MRQTYVAIIFGALLIGGAVWQGAEAQTVPMRVEEQLAQEAPTITTMKNVVTVAVASANVLDLYHSAIRSTRDNVHDADQYCQNVIARIDDIDPGKTTVPGRALRHLQEYNAENMDKPIGWIAGQLSLRDIQEELARIRKRMESLIPIAASDPMTAQEREAAATMNTEELKALKEEVAARRAAAVDAWLNTPLEEL